MPVPSAQLGLPQIAGTDTPDIPRDMNAIISRFEALRNTFATRPVLDVGQVGQIRAGRPLTVADFTNMGLSTPLLLANLSTLAGAGSNLGSGGNLTNKGAVPNAPGIMGAAAEAAQFAGATTQALYIPDAGASDPFRIRTGSWGCWFRTAKRGIVQYIMSKESPAPGNWAWGLKVEVASTATVFMTIDGSTAIQPTGSTDVADDRWHLGICTFDGTRLRLYIDGALEAQLAVQGVIFAAAAPLNIGGYGADAAAAAGSPFYGRVDEAFVTADVLSDDQVRYLYCAALAHTAVALGGVRLNVRRRRRGVALAVADFPVQPARLYNFPNGDTAVDLGSNNVALTGGAIAVVAGPDGSIGGARHYGGAGTVGDSSTDAGLPAGLTARSYGGWFKTTTVAGGTLIGWGTQGSADARLLLLNAAAATVSAWSGGDSITGPVVNDGFWHFIAVVEDNAAPDSKRKLYVDGRLVAGTTVMNTLTLAGAGKFRIGANPDGTTGPFAGQASRLFVYAGALTPDQVRALYNVSSQALPPSPKDAASHVESIEAARILATFDVLESCDLIDLALVP